MDIHPGNDEGFEDEGRIPWPRNFFFWLRDEVYTRLVRRDKVYFTENEVRYMIDVIDFWNEGHRDIDPDDDELDSFFETFSIGVDVRNKLWKQLTEEK